MNESADAVEEPFVPAGNPLRPRALVGGAASFLALVVLMAADWRLPLGVLLGFLAAVLASFGALDFAGVFDDGPTERAAALPKAQLGARLLWLLAALTAVVVALRLAVAGVLPTEWLPSVLVTLGALAVVVAAARLVELWSDGSTALSARPGFWLVLLGVSLYVPFMGSYSLLDPWETHYGEVAREMLARDDWLSFWWAHEGWFWSKPALDFWLQGLSFALLGVKYQPDQMLANAALGYAPQPEWAARLPVVVLTLVAVFALYRFVSQAVGKRAGFLAGTVLLSAPYWSLLAHQSMTDMPYVAPLTTALSLFGLGLLAAPDELAEAKTVLLGKRELRVSAAQALFALITISVLPQLSYLASRNVTLQVAGPPYGFRWHLDELFSGSGLGNCGLPGNEACRAVSPGNALFQPMLSAAIFGAALFYFLWLNRGERRKKRLYYQAAWYFTALAALAKGAPGLVLPLTIAVATLIARRDYRELTRVELASLGLTFAAVCLPWYVQAFMRHGEPFTDRLLMHDMYKRAFVHVHDTNAGTDVSLRYYVWQLGYGLFPWTGLAPLGLGMALAAGDDQQRGRRDLGLLMALWAAIAFALFTLSLTKFHHYALPCTPPLAVGAALLLDRAWGARPLPRGRRGARYAAGLAAAAALLIAGGVRLQAGSLGGQVVDGRPVPEAVPWLAVSLLAAGLGLSLASEWRWGADDAGARDEADAGLPTLALLALPLTLLVARDLSTSYDGDVPGSARLLHLMTYNYKRSWPATLSFEAAQWGFGVASALALLLWCWPRLRRAGVVLLSAVGVAFCAFTLWGYLPALAPHFGQRELMLTYYRVRRGPQEPLVAYQMNWKGENFYTGNRLPAFVSTGARFERWLKTQRKRGTKVLYFVVEHGRIGALKSELSNGARARPVTDKSLNDKFALVRAELGD